VFACVRAMPPVPPPIGQRRLNAGPRGAHADLLRRVHEIFGPLPVIDASEPLTLHPLPIDAEGAEPRDPGNCLLAHCAAREFGARSVAFFRGTTYLDRIGPDGGRRIDRYMNSASARRLIVSFDSGTQPITADTTLTLLAPYKQFTRCPQHVAAERVNGWLAILEAPDMQRSRLAEFDLRPFQITYLGRPETVPKGGQDQRGVRWPP
jgi:hypothetical protein